MITPRLLICMVPLLTMPVAAQQISSVTYTPTFNNIGIDVALSATPTAGSTISASFSSIK